MRFITYRQSWLNGSTIQTGLAHPPARCVTVVSMVMTRSQLAHQRRDAGGIAQFTFMSVRY
ncbi:MAG: hypothetical protein B7Z80_12410 [Rhodospirillales bacterium 20-64-7]|nr:MAG: hypothetical protein B7Z80_12410 [Rhodospirillales bacterium 20-64-7]